MAKKYQLHGAFPSKAGDSAYEVAQKNGFKGTEQEWLASLVGPRGPQGLPGEDGKDGSGGSGVYVGSGEMPEGYNIQIDPTGEAPVLVQSVNGVKPDENGNVEVQTAPDSEYTLPIATPDTLGGVKPVTKSEDMTQPVGVDELGGLWSVPRTGGTVSGGGNTYTYEYTVELSENVEAFQIHLPCTTDKLLMWNVILLIPTYEGNSADKQNLYVNLGGNANLNNVLPANSIVLTALRMGEFMKIHHGGRSDNYYANINTTMGQGTPSEVSSTQDWISFTTPSSFIFATGTKIMLWGVYAE